MAQPLDICIRGDGIVGCTLALLLARERLRVGVVSPPAQAQAADPSTRPDVRAYALNRASKKLLEALRCWPAPALVTPVQHMQIRGDRQGEVNFDAVQSQADALAWIVDAAALQSQLKEAMRFSPQIEWLSAPQPAALTVVCEGKASTTRDELGVAFETFAYAQHAIAARLTCEQAHGQVARQWFSNGEILAFLPLDGEQGNSVAVVWSVTPEHAAQWAQGSTQDFCHALETLSQHRLGELKLCSERVTWPLQKSQAKRWVGRNKDLGPWALAGDAAHTVHPLAGQGLNMGLADVAELARLIHARDDWRAVGDAKLLRQYERSRKAGIVAMQTGTDGLQWLFSQGDKASPSLRNWGMNLVERSGFLKQWMAKQAMNF
jgi:2-polyprenyl-6-methoxyphenol hydroxylase-like FAD-dependent oxidoreductase